MAAGVLEQAKKDLRRFHQGTTGVERELYLDAYRWVTSDDCTWPLSFFERMRASRLRAKKAPPGINRRSFVRRIALSDAPLRTHG